MKKSIKFDLNSDYQDIEKAKEIGNKFLGAQGFPDDVVTDQITIIRELIKYGINFGHFPPLINKITVCIQITADTIAIEVTHLLDHSCCNKLKRLDKAIQLIRGSQDPFEAYLFKQKEASISTFNDEANGLELARIAHERATFLDFFVSKDKELSLIAVSKCDSGNKN